MQKSSNLLRFAQLRRQGDRDSNQGCLAREPVPLNTTARLWRPRLDSLSPRGLARFSLSLDTHRETGSWHCSWGEDYYWVV